MWKWIVVAIAIAGAVGAALLAAKSTAAQPIPPPRQQPVRKPFARAIVGAGIVEPESENVVIGVRQPGYVMKVFVAKGQAVKAGDPLFHICTCGLEADKVVAEAALRTAQTELQRVQAYRRPEEEPQLRAKLDAATAFVLQAQSDASQAEAAVTENDWNVKDHETRLKRLEATVRANASPQQDLDLEQYAVKMAEAKLAEAKAKFGSTKAQIGTAQAQAKLADADLKLYLAGSWPPDVAKAQAAVEEAKANIEKIKTVIGLQTTRAPRDGTVLRFNLHEGEYISAGTTLPEQAPVVLGDLSRWNVRIDIDEFDAGRFHPGAPAAAFFKGQAAPTLKLEFVSVEPFVIPKRALTNSQQELVDTRVLQVIYRVTPANVSLYVGQQLDVFIEEADTDLHSGAK